MNRLVVMISLSGEGGVERMILNLVREFAAQPGLAVDVALVREESRHLRELPPGAAVVRIGFRHRARRPTDCLPPAPRGFGRAACPSPGRGADARRHPPRHDAVGGDQGGGRLQRWLRYLLIRELDGWASAIVAVSEGVATDTVAIAGLPTGRVHVVRSLVDRGRGAAIAAAAVIREAGCLVGVETGLSHLGNAMGTPTLALFGSTRPCLALGVPRARVLYQAPPCSPYRRRPICHGRYHCMRLHAVDTVAQAVAEIADA